MALGRTLPFREGAHKRGGVHKRKVPARGLQRPGVRALGHSPPSCTAQRRQHHRLHVVRVQPASPNLRPRCGERRWKHEHSFLQILDAAEAQCFSISAAYRAR